MKGLYITVIIVFLCLNHNKKVVSSTNLMNIKILKNTIITSIYYDERIKSIRLILIHTKKSFPNISCQLLVKNRIKNCRYMYNPYMINAKPHGHLIIPISYYKYPDKLFLNNIDIPIPKPYKTNNIYKLSVCICKTVNYTAVNRVIQTIETYRYFGVDHFSIYKTSVSIDIEKVFEYYQKLGILEIIKWNKTLEFSKLLHDYGQIYKNNDCLYRNMYRSKALIITDWDEIITSVQYNNILEMISKRYDKKYNWYVFKSFLFHTEIYSKSDKYNTNIPDADIYAYKQYCIFRDGLVVKNLYTYLPAIYEIETHYVGNGSSKLNKVKVNTKDGFIRHTKRISSINVSFCQSKWMLYPLDKREDIIKRKVDNIKQKLHITTNFKLIPTIFI